MADTAPNAQQIDYWNDVAGRVWAEFHALLDQQIAPLGEQAMRALAPQPGHHILDIGCGCGHSTLALASAVGPNGKVVGIDLSAPMLAVARQRPWSADMAPVEFRQADAQSEALGPFDAGFSRFGVMFFADPVAAFTNLRAALKPGGRLAFVCWRGLEDNPWMRLPLEAALPCLPPLTRTDPLAPGPFALADAGRVHRILAAAAFDRVTITPFDALIGGADLEQTRRLSFRVGPLAAALRDHPDCAPLVADRVRDALAGHLRDGCVWMSAGVWIVTAA